MALLEAIRIGCIPVVSDYKIANREIIQDGKSGFIIPHNDVNAFVDRLVDIAKNHPNYRNIYEESYKTFVNVLSFPKWKKHINAVIADNTATHKPRVQMTASTFKWCTWRFRMLDKYNFLENHVKEVLPCAIRFYKFYKINK